MGEDEEVDEIYNSCCIPYPGRTFFIKRSELGGGSS